MLEWSETNLFSCYCFLFFCFYLSQFALYITFEIVCMYGDIIIIIKNSKNENTLCYVGNVSWV